MALNELMDRVPEVVQMIPDTGVQFLDLGFSIPQRDDDVPTEWGFFDPRKGEVNARAPRFCRRGNQEAEGVESYSVDVRRLVKMFDRVWVPLPLLREQGKGFFRGPTNWARAYLARLDTPDARGNDYRLVIALDTTLLDYDEDGAYLAPSAQDARTGRKFRLPTHKDDIDWFHAEPWVRDWMMETFTEMLHRDERARRGLAFKPFTPEEVLDRMEGSNEPMARYRAWLDLLHSLAIVPGFVLEDRVSEPRKTPIDVDLVLDLGNSRSCGLLIESDPSEARVDMSSAVVLLQLRDLGRAEQVYSEPFPSQFEFARASFGSEHLSQKSGRSGAFGWPSIVRIGPEAVRLSTLRSGVEGLTGLSSPKRYLWDEDPQPDSWRVNAATLAEGENPFATGVAFTALVNDLGETIHRLGPADIEQMPDRGILALRALYSRRNLASFALGEIFMQAMQLMNAPMHRYRRPANAGLPRRLRRIIMTLPTAMPLVERKILREQAESARDLVYLALGLATLEETEDGRSRLAYTLDGRLHPDRPQAGPEVILQWDEATATQAVYLYTQVAQNFSGGAHAFFDSVRRPENALDPATARQLRLATLDIGGGTTDLVITSFTADGQGNHVTIEPFQEFREGFNLAGDDVLLEIIGRHLLDPIEQALSQAGLGASARSVLDFLVGGNHGNKQAIEYVRRQQFAARVAAPIGLALLRDYEAFDPLEPGPDIDRTVEAFFKDVERPPESLFAHFNATVAKAGLPGFRLQDLRLRIPLAALDATVRSTLYRMLRDVSDVLHRYRCDLLLVSGRSSCMPAVPGLLRECAGLPAHRVIPLNQFRVGGWYPFRAMGASTLGDPKTTAAVGAMICLLGQGRLQNFNLRSDRLRPRSTARYFGKLSNDQRVLDADVYHDDLDLDNPDYRLPEDRSFQFRGPLPLGFRQLPMDWWTASRLYTLEWRSADDVARYGRLVPLKVVLRRKPARAVPSGGEDERVVEHPELEIQRVETDGGQGSVPKDSVRLRLQTLDDAAGYWLDTGILLRN